MNAIKFEADGEGDLEARKRLLDAAKALADATSKMVEAAKVSICNFFFDRTTQGSLKVSVYLQQLGSMYDTCIHTHTYTRTTLHTKPHASQTPCINTHVQTPCKYVHTGIPMTTVSTAYPQGVAQLQLHCCYATQE